MKFFYSYLSYAGTIPLLYCAVCFIVNIHTIPIFGYTDRVLSGYGLVISAFMAGSHWGLHLRLTGKWELYLPVISNINAIILWTSFIVFPFKTLLIIFIISFLILFVIDNKLFKCGFISREYIRTRLFVTLIVVSSLIVSGIYA